MSRLFHARKKMQAILREYAGLTAEEDAAEDEEGAPVPSPTGRGRG
jgi:hypothetical protein